MSAFGFQGQKCSAGSRAIIHEKVYDTFKKKLVAAYKQLSIGDPLNEKNHIGPLIDKDAVQQYLNAIAALKEQGGKVVVPGGVFRIVHMDGRRIERVAFVPDPYSDVDASE